MPKHANAYSDKDIATNLLVSLKHMKAEFNLFSQEASNDTLLTEIDALYASVSQLQREVFDMMCEQSWYKMTPDTAKSIAKAYTTYSNSESELAK